MDTCNTSDSHEIWILKDVLQKLQAKRLFDVTQKGGYVTQKGGHVI